MLYFLFRINNYVRNGQQDNLVDPTADQIYVKTKELQVQARAKNTDLNYWIKHPFEFSDPILKPEYL